MSEIVESIIPIPEDVQVALDGKKVTVTGQKGKVTKDFSHVKLQLSTVPAGFLIRAVNPRKLEVALVGTIGSHIKNMIKGVTEGYVYKMKIVFVHFPMTVKIIGREVHIENFVGERKARIASIIGDTKVSVKQDDVIIEGIDKDDVGQTAGNIHQRGKIRNKDLRKFLDGIYVYSRE
jgi:large subunit ribosomal protein L6